MATADLWSFVIGIHPGHIIIGLHWETKKFQVIIVI